MKPEMKSDFVFKNKQIKQQPNIMVLLHFTIDWFEDKEEFQVDLYGTISDIIRFLP